VLHRCLSNPLYNPLPTISAAAEQNLRGLAQGDAAIDGDPSDKDKSYIMVLIVCLVIAISCAGCGFAWVKYFANKKAGKNPFC